MRAALLQESKKEMLQFAGKKPYYLDRASVAAADALPEGGMRILDMCAAPGGKSVRLAQNMAEGAALVCNERSKERYRRLLVTLEDCIPNDIRSRISAMRGDGALLWRKHLTFDRILLDAPCSSERHVIADEKYLKQWSPARIKSLAFEQYALISSAWRMLSPGGHLVYCTCALCSEENEGVIAKLLHKREDAEVVRASFTLPDEADGAGPMYFAVVKKRLVD